jgi:hypothetical protein
MGVGLGGRKTRLEMVSPMIVLYGVLLDIRIFQDNNYDFDLTGSLGLADYS